MTEAVFVPDGHRFVATELARGPWDPHAQHGGAPAALMLRAFERLAGADGLVFARVTYEFLRPVALVALELRAELARSGRRAALLEGSIVDEEGTELVRARGLRVRRAERDFDLEPPDPSGPGVRTGASALAASTSVEDPPGPDSGSPSESFAWARRPMFATDAMDIRFTSGNFAELGPAGAWFRMRVPLVAGEPTTPLQRLAAAADFGNGISSIVPWDNHLFINPDLTLYIGREPVGEWIHLEAHTRIAPGGIGMSASALHDERGEVGHATQALLVQRTR